MLNENFKEEILDAIKEVWQEKKNEKKDVNVDQGIRATEIYENFKRFFGKDKVSFNVSNTTGCGYVTANINEVVLSGEDLLTFAEILKDSSAFGIDCGYNDGHIGFSVTIPKILIPVEEEN